MIPLQVAPAAVEPNRAPHTLASPRAVRLSTGLLAAFCPAILKPILW